MTDDDQADEKAPDANKSRKVKPLPNVDKDLRGLTGSGAPLEES